MPILRFAVVIPIVLLLLTADSPAQTITTFGIPTPNSNPLGITTDPAGNVWFAENGANKIGRMTPGGVFTEFVVPTPGAHLVDLTYGPDGNIWFVELVTNKIGKLTPAGIFTEYSIPTANQQPSSIVAGPDGNLWFTGYSGVVGYITTTGSVTEFPVVANPTSITVGSDGNLWFTEYNQHRIGRVTPTGVITEFPTPTANSGPYSIAAGVDGNLWFTERSVNKIGRLTPSGVFTEFPIPTTGADVIGITAGGDGRLWFAEHNSSKIGAVSVLGVFDEIDVSMTAPAPHNLTTGPDGDIWFTDHLSNLIARIDLVFPTPTPTATATATPTETATPPPTPTSTPTPPVAVCNATPDMDCRKPTRPGKASILLKDRSPDNRDLVGWKWGRGAATLKADFGDPLTTTDYALCVYDEASGTPTLKLSAMIPAAGMCGTRPCWQSTKRGFRYLDKAGTADGIVSVTLKEGFEGSAQIAAKGLGLGVDMPVLPLQQDPRVIVQLRNDLGICWDAEFGPPASTTTSIQFRDRSD